MYKTFSVTLQSVSPLLMHNGRLADPLEPITRAMKHISAQRHKTDADLEELARLEWYGGLYLQDGAPCNPAKCWKHISWTPPRNAAGGSR